MKEFHHISYDIHEKSFEGKETDANEIELYENWLDNETVDLWRHNRMFQCIAPLLNHYKNSNWVAVGDGRFGTAAQYINRQGSQALPVDIDDSLLKIAQEKGWIDNYKKENAEALSFDNQTFDFAFCKEAFHHFPRAYLGLYEMLRVSKKAVVLVEPNDWLPGPFLRRALQLFKHKVFKVIGKNIPHPDTGNYETVGNYVFTVSEREIQKIALGLNLPAVAVKKFHDIYIKGVEQEKMSPQSALYKKIKQKIDRNNILFKLGISDKNRIAAIIFKETPPETLRSELQKEGFDIIDLPSNPFVK